MTYFFNPSVLLVWIGASWLIGLLGRNKRFGFVGNFLIAFVFSPLVGVIVLLASEPMAPRRPKHN
ncbi:hypothetical protein [Alkalilimnicola sp. S0819]|uniref:hypothetical protein n=1 Tax=Alkalilimnicola sp. S0819 TaxID=2613922 RepID=UPI0012621B19|nr:hypothetical protein [Alkalilimnicola sp. S0819]KAB7627762.1 hypothetical protein F3N43_01930 [Alkalilimnicola sp. S0819]MPQ15386.1 hypothetical protein [Alkalilimnicola sp. S0819]